MDKASGLSTLLKNNYDGTKFTFANMGIINAGSTCVAGYGYDLHDLSVRWNDVDGDGRLYCPSESLGQLLTSFLGRADFLCMWQDGTINGYFNKGVGNMVWAGQIKHTEGRERKSKFPGRFNCIWIRVSANILLLRP